MKKNILALLLIVYTSISFSQFSTAFDKQEAKNMAAISNYWINGMVEGQDSTFADPEYKLVYQSKIFKMKNEWQLLEKSNDAIVIHLRGTARESVSWFANFYASMIPAQGEMVLPDSQKVKYKFAEDPRAAVHVGWAMGIEFMMSDILKKIKEYNDKGIYNIYITGHSQGGALAHLLRASFEYLPDNVLSKKNRYKVYTIASPKPGNRFLAYDYATYTSLKNPSFSIINNSDWVPMLPFTVQSTDNMPEINPFNSLNNNEFDMSLVKRIVVKHMFNSLVKPIDKSQKRLIKTLGKDMRKKIEDIVGEFEVPNSVKDFAYFPMGLQVVLKPIKGKSDDKLVNMFWQHLPAHYIYLIEEQL